MTIETEIVKIQLRRGTSLQWYTNNPVLSTGEFGYETDTGNCKAGDGATDWRNLGYINANATQKSIVDLVYPVGSIYMNFNPTDPSTLFAGTTWVALDEGRVLLGANSTYTSGSTGGEATHTLTTAEMPSHTHTGTTGNQSANHTHTRGTMDITGTFDLGDRRTHIANPTGAFYTNTASSALWAAMSSATGNVQGVGFTASRNWTGSTSTQSANHTHSFTSAATGSGTSHNIMQPYLAVYMWKRTA